MPVAGPVQAPPPTPAPAPRSQNLHLSQVPGVGAQERATLPGGGGVGSRGDPCGGSGCVLCCELCRLNLTEHPKGSLVPRSHGGRDRWVRAAGTRCPGPGGAGRCVQTGLPGLKAATQPLVFRGAPSLWTAAIMGPGGRGVSTPPPPPRAEEDPATPPSQQLTRAEGRLEPRI